MIKFTTLSFMSVPRVSSMTKVAVCRWQKKLAGMEHLTRFEKYSLNGTDRFAASLVPSTAMAKKVVIWGGRRLGMIRGSFIYRVRER